ncbi:MAG: hypothetical protein WC810_24645 [Janthinobacterium sp.]|jgi:hypothetical protein
MRSRKKGSLDIIGAEKYPDKDFRWVRKDLMQSRGMMDGYQVVKKDEFPDLGVGFNDFLASADEPSYITYRDVILMFRPKELSLDRDRDKMEDIKEQTLLNNGIPNEIMKLFVKDMAAPLREELEAAVDYMSKLPSGSKPGTPSRVAKPIK